MDRDELAKTLGFSRSDVDMLMDMFLKNARTSLQAMENAIQQNSMHGIADAAHAIKGISGNLKMDEIFELSRDINYMAKSSIDRDYAEDYQRLKSLIEKIV